MRARPRRPLILGALLLCAGRGAAAALAMCEAEDCANDDPSLLQSHRRPPAPAQASAGMRALANEGGGFRALSTQVGITTAMLTALRSGGKAACLGDLFSAILVVSSNSGGSWFSSELFYSRRFNELLLEMSGVDPADAGDVFSSTWLAELTAKTSPESRARAQKTMAARLKVTAAAANLVTENPEKIYDSINDVGVASALKEIHNVSMADVHGLLGNAGLAYAQNQAQAMFLLAKDESSSWEDLNHDILFNTAGIDADVTLGSPPQPWAKGKTWLACTSIVAPNTGAPAYYYVAKDLEEKSLYQATYPSQYGQRQYIPSRFSIVLGSGADAAAPYPFCASEECFGAGLNISGVSSGGDALQPEKAAESLGSAAASAFTSSAGRLPVFQVASASNAALGILIFSKYVVALTEEFANLAVWASSAGGGLAFDTGFRALESQVSDGVTPSSVEALTADAVHAHIDGAYTDNTGIAWAVSVGATEVTALLNGGPSSLAALGSGSDLISGVPPFIFEQHPIFVETNTSLQDAYDALPQLLPPAGSRGLLSGIKYGTLTVTTIANEWFGIAAGRVIKLNLISPETSGVSMLALNDLNEYGRLVGDITTTFAANEQVAADILEEFFLAAAAA